MAVTLHILRSSGRLAQFEDALERAHEQVVQKVSEKLPLPDVDVVAVDNPSAAISEIGVGGYAPTAHFVYVSIDPTFANLAASIQGSYASTLAHELHHCVRWQTVGYGETLGEALVTEGLAEHFDIEINGGKPTLWATAVQGDALADLERRAHEELDSKEYDHWMWFFGDRSGSIPKWTGYSLGFEIVGRYLKATGKTAAELVAEPAESIIS